MAKLSKETLRAPVDFEKVLSLGLRDLEKYLPEETNRELTRLVSNPVAFRDRIEDKLPVAVASGGFLEVAALRQLHAFVKKNTDLPGTNPGSRKENALRKFDDAEKRCRITNRRLAFYRTHISRIPKKVSRVVFMARDFVQRIMGPLGPAELYQIIAASDFGPGFTFLSKEQESKNLYFKMLGDHSMTPDALPYAKILLRQRRLWFKALADADATFDYVRGNRVTTVPKDAVTDRTIAIEPSFNVMLQKGVDHYLKGKLRHFGVNLHNQEMNHPPARSGSMAALESATIDLESASDSVSTELVRWLLPSEWVTLLDDLRSKEYTLDKGKSWHPYAKFSSMGNANTFPLETIIFYAVAKACSIVSGGKVSGLRVYGDDIVIDPCAALLLIEVLRFLGFRTNKEKSFLYGWFRETCGVDYLCGVDLRPVYLRRLCKTDQEVFCLFNRLLHNRVGFRFHNLCEYLFGLPKRPLVGPPDLPPGRKYWTWYAGKSVEVDRYFHAPSSSGERFLRFDPDLQRQVWRAKALRFTPKRLNTSNLQLQFWYLVFLYGGRAGSGIDSVSRFRRFYSTVDYYRWTEPPWRPWLFDSVSDSVPV